MVVYRVVCAPLRECCSEYFSSCIYNNFRNKALAIEEVKTDMIRVFEIKTLLFPDSRQGAFQSLLERFFTDGNIRSTLVLILDSQRHVKLWVSYQTGVGFCQVQPSE